MHDRVANYSIQQHNIYVSYIGCRYFDLSSAKEQTCRKDKLGDCVYNYTCILCPSSSNECLFVHFSFCTFRLLFWLISKWSWYRSGYSVADRFFLPMRYRVRSIFSGAGKFCLAHGLRQLILNTKSDVCWLQTLLTRRFGDLQMTFGVARHTTLVANILFKTSILFREYVRIGSFEFVWRRRESQTSQD